MSRQPGLYSYLSLAALGMPAARRRIASEIARGGKAAARAAERLGQASAPRREGPLVWVHASTPAQEAALADLARRIVEQHPGTGLLLTTDAPPAPGGPHAASLTHQYVPLDASGPVAAFLDHWRPDVGLWAGTELRPALIHAAADRGTRLCLVDAAEAPASGRGWHGYSGLIGSTLRRFDEVLATDGEAAEALVGAGAARRSVRATGPLEAETAALGCNMGERDALGAALSTRPVWLAVAVPAAEDMSVIGAHRVATRLAHRLLLIMVPDRPDRGPDLARKLATAGLSVALRSVEGEPDPTTEVFVADAEGELGLWYRLAPVTFMGGTLGTGAGGGRSPLEPAALGSAILHGPEIGPHASAYGRFWEARAARRVADGAGLGAALSELLSPDKAAAMAHQAWRVSTGGADVNDRVLAFVGDALARQAPR